MDPNNFAGSARTYSTGTRLRIRIRLYHTKKENTKTIYFIWHNFFKPFFVLFPFEERSIRILIIKMKFHICNTAAPHLLSFSMSCSISSTCCFVCVSFLIDFLVSVVPCTGHGINFKKYGSSTIYNSTVQYNNATVQYT